MEGFKSVSERDIMVMFHMLREYPLNTPLLIFQWMHEAASRSKVSLAYGMILTLMFGEYDVKLEEDISRALMHNNTYNDHSLYQMGYTKINSHWVRKGGGRQDEPKDNEEHA